MNDQNEGTDGPSEREEISAPISEKPTFRKWVGVNIKVADGHYVATFNHGEPRIFHNIQQLLTAIEIESAKLGPGPTQT